MAINIKAIKEAVRQTIAEKEDDFILPIVVPPLA